MNLKESYRYANYLDNLLDTAYAFLNDTRFVTTTNQRHLRSKMNDKAMDESTTIQKPFDVTFKPNDVVNFVVKVLAEKEALATAIADSKSHTEIDIDNAIAMNKKKQRFTEVLKKLEKIKPSERQIQGSDYRFNINNEQVKYFYPVEETTTIDFNRNDIRKLIKKYLKETDEISTKLDSIVINTEVLFEPKWDVNDDFEDIVMAV